MKCYGKKTKNELVLYVDDVEAQYEENVIAGWYKKTASGYCKIFNMTDKDNGVTDADISIICANFSKLGPVMFEGCLDWKKALLIIADKFSENNIEWYVFGSVSDVLRGINIIPHDLDIIVHTKDFVKVKDIFLDCVVEPFMDCKNNWIVRYFGRMSILNSYVDVVAAESLNAENHSYDNISWNGHNILIELFDNRYNLELKRNRPERIKAMDEYRYEMKQTKKQNS